VLVLVCNRTGSNVVVTHACGFSLGHNGGHIWQVSACSLGHNGGHICGFRLGHNGGHICGFRLGHNGGHIGSF
jgi:hypothetical protein